MSVFKDQKQFMDVSGQIPSTDNTKLYMELIWEEFQETAEAFTEYMLDQENLSAQAEVVDGALDLIYVACGLIHSMGLDPQPLWDEVQRSNMSKFIKKDDGSYEVLRRADGKILKPLTFFKPDLKGLIREQRQVPA